MKAHPDLVLVTILYFSLFRNSCSFSWAGKRLSCHMHAWLNLNWFSETSEACVRWRGRGQQQPEHSQSSVPRSTGPGQEGSQVLCGVGRQRQRRRRRRHVWLTTASEGIQQHSSPDPSSSPPTVSPQTFVHLPFWFSLMVVFNDSFFLMCRCFTLFIIHIQVSFFKCSFKMFCICPKQLLEV